MGAAALGHPQRLIRVNPEVEERVERIESEVATLRDEMYRTSPNSPGISLRLDRIERLLQAMLKFGGAAAGLGLIWKALEVVGAIVGRAAGG